MTEANFADIPREVYYDDGFVTLDRRGITIRGYYWPLCLSTAIPYSDIVQFGTTDDLDVSCCAYSNWGLGLGNVWWALGCRCFMCCCPCGELVIDTYDGVRKGCTVRDLHKVLAILQRHAPDAAPYGHMVGDSIDELEEPDSSPLVPLVRGVD